MAIYKTTGEVEMLTGIPKRQIKYYIESGFFTPSKKELHGKKTIWYYSKDDINKLNQIKLYSELDYSNTQIKELVTNPNFNWNDALEDQISLLRKKKKHIENLLVAAECMRLTNDLEKEYCDFDITDFDNDIDSFSDAIFSPEAEENAELGLVVLGEQINTFFSNNDINEFCSKCYEYFVELKKIVPLDPKDEIVQRFISNLHKNIINFCPSFEFDLNVFLFGIRLFLSLGTDRFVDTLFNTKNMMMFFEGALQEYVKNIELGGNRNG